MNIVIFHTSPGPVVAYPIGAAILPAGEEKGGSASPSERKVDPARRDGFRGARDDQRGA